jgi:hypothetical protein
MSRRLSKEDLKKMSVESPFGVSGDFIKKTEERATGPQIIKANREGRPPTAGQQEVEDILALEALQNQYDAEQRQYQVQAQTAAARQQPLGKARLPQAGDLLRRRSIAITMFSVHGGIWSTVQTPLVVFSLIFFGLAAGLDSTWIGQVVGTVAKGANSVTSLLGADFSALKPRNIFLIFHFFIFGLMFLAVFSTMMIYAVYGYNPFGGDRAGLKFGALLVCIAGYSIPFANLLPWIFLYVWVMAITPGRRS